MNTKLVLQFIAVEIRQDFAYEMNADFLLAKPRNDFSGGTVLRIISKQYVKLGARILIVDPLLGRLDDCDEPVEIATCHTEVE